MKLSEALKARCLTPGAIFHTKIGAGSISVTVDLGEKKLELSEQEAAQLERNLHNAVELALSGVWNRE